MIWVFAIILSISHQGTLKELSWSNMPLLCRFITTIKVCGSRGDHIFRIEISLLEVCTICAGDRLEIQCKFTVCCTEIRGKFSIHTVSFWARIWHSLIPLRQLHTVPDRPDNTLPPIRDMRLQLTKFRKGNQLQLAKKHQDKITVSNLLPNSFY